MPFKQIIEIYEFLDSPLIKESELKELFINKGLEESEIEIHRVKGERGETIFIKIKICGKDGKLKEGKAPTLGIIGQLGGIGARPHKIGLVSDADGAITALASAMKIIEMRKKGDMLKGDVIITTHLCPNSPVIPHEPVPFMGAPISIEVMNKYCVDKQMDAILSIDTTKGNRIINQRGFAISPTVKDGYILRVSEDLLDIMEIVSGKLPVVFAITTQDITPYGNEIYHLNSIMQPSTATTAPVVGVAITTEIPVPGCATGANHCLDIEMAVRFVIEVAKAFGEGKCSFYDEDEFQKLLSLYGSMEHLKTLGRRS
ncbi:DUF1177 domain-containing protein [Candidatus Aminicenantes bacterium AC-335-B20]|jgi:hypothetical protein|nr:DUF1177 domain-containing protein [SCandidatus Aminicenantes bacterium Aminicenantia_JdfR_composite]MCP2598953.1 DUF1177 domain-containing protein [Candidatus Aminicenantes bacterium AC-335-B20]